MEKQELNEDHQCKQEEIKVWESKMGQKLKERKHKLKHLIKAIDREIRKTTKFILNNVIREKPLG